MTDALDTTLLLLSIDEGKRLLGAYPNVSAFWIGDGRQLKAEYRSGGSATADSR
jgi:hypothetical protein